MTIKWPNGKESAKFKSDVGDLADYILNGRLICIDPASRTAGKAYFEAGKLISAGEIIMPSRGTIQQRLRVLVKTLSESPEIDVLAIEKIRGGRSHVYLKWSVGAAIATVKSKQLIEIPISFWRAIRPQNYIKNDKNDATLMGYCLILMAMQLKEMEDTDAIMQEIAKLGEIK